MCRPCALVTVFLWSASAIHAHDLWLIPPKTAMAEKTLTLEASVGGDFPVSEVAHDTAKYPRKFVIAPDGKTLPLKSAGKKDLVALMEFVPASAGIHVAAVETTPRILKLEADKFNEYLVSDGLPHIFRLRHKEKTLNQPAVERYRKSPTALVQVGEGKNGLWDQPLDLPLQIVPVQNPFERKLGNALRVRVYFQKRPLKEANVGWQHPGDGDGAAGYVRTDAKGEALVPVAQTGLMTIRLTHMTRPKTAEYEWESFWTTLTFRVP